MNIYIASHSAELARELASELHVRGYKIKSSWHDKEKTLTASKDLAQYQKEEIFERDINDLYNSDLLILISGSEKYSGGKFVETGYAMGLQIPVIVYGDLENVMLSKCHRVNKYDYAGLCRLMSVIYPKDYDIEREDQ